MAVCVIGAGIVGLAVARDLALRDIECILIEHGIPGCGTTSHCAGMLHSGARYAIQTPALARQCAIANQETRDVAQFAVRRGEGLFVCLEDDPPEYADQFSKACPIAGIPIRALTRREALEYEPGLGALVARAFLTPDGVLDPFALVDAHVEDLTRLGVEILLHHTFLHAVPCAYGWRLEVEDRQKKSIRTIVADVVVNAAGPWAGEVVAAFGIQLPLVYVHGSMVVLKPYFVDRVVTRCAPTSAGDVIIPSGGACLVGSTWHHLSHTHPVQIDPYELSTVIETASAMIPQIALEHVINSYTGIRVHVGSPVDTSSNNEFSLPRDYSVIDHSRDSIPGVFTTLGGKLTLYRYVAELAGDAVVKQLGIERSCETQRVRLPAPKWPSGRALSDPR